jgi:hypothetical protein
MTLDSAQLPNDIATLKAMVIAAAASPRPAQLDVLWLRYGVGRGQQLSTP